MILGCCLALPTAASAATSYVVTVDESLTRIDVRACFADGPPRALEAATHAARPLLEHAALVHDGLRRSLEVTGGELEIVGARPGDCVEYRVQVAAAAAGQRAGLRRIENAVIGPSSSWLWQPPEPDRNTTLHFDLPADLEVSAPWPETGEHTFLLTDTPPGWRDQIAVGRLARVDLPVTGGHLRLALIGRLRFKDPDGFRVWLTEAAAAVSGLYGRFPVPDAQVLLLPATGSPGAVPWGQVLRGGAPAVLFIVNPDRPLAEFRDDWTAVHEFSHLLLPFVSRRDAWVSEGFASYYQNVLRARAGMIDPTTAWSKLWAGFGRGRAATNDTLSLAQATREMYGPNLMRVYWAGAALALDADIELRRHSPSGRGLDDVLDALGRCCLAPGKVWTGKALFAKLDRLAGTEFLQTMYLQYAKARVFPDVDAMFMKLGIEPRGETVRLAGDPAQAALRAEIDGSAPRTASLHDAAANGQRNVRKDRSDP